MHDAAEKALNYIDNNINKIRSCIESYVERTARLNHATVFSIFRSTESEVIRKCGLVENRTMHNLLRQHIMDRLMEEEIA